MNSFVNYFNYDASTIKLIDRVNYSYLDWIKTIHQELQNKRPVFFSGSSPNSGHSFVIDGYYTQDYFYINWGWNGLEDKHAFRLSLCNPGKKYEGGGVGDAGYSGAQLAIIGIQPASTPSTLTPYLRAFSTGWAISPTAALPPTRTSTWSNPSSTDSTTRHTSTSLSVLVSLCAMPTGRRCRACCHSAPTMRI